MSPPIMNPSGIISLLDRYAEEFNHGTPDATVLDEIRRRLPTASDPQEFRHIADNAWDKYFSVDVNTMIDLLRHWVAIDPQSKEAQRALGSYLLAHGPDWDDEGHRLLAQAP